MRRDTVVLLTAALATAACDRPATTNAPPPTLTATPSTPVAPTAPTAPNALGGSHEIGMNPEFGGTVMGSTDMRTEVVTQPDGRLLAYVRNGQGASVPNASVRVLVHNADGTSHPVAVAWDGTQSAYVGYVWGVQPGAKTVDVSVQPSDAPVTAQPVTMSALVNVAGVATPPAPRHGGTMEIIGQYAVEVVPARTGDVAFFVTDLQGNPVPTGDVQLPQVRANVASSNEVAYAAPVVMTPTREGDHFVARGYGPAMASAPYMGFDVDLDVGPHQYRHGHMWRAPVMQQMPPGVVVAYPTGNNGYPQDPRGGQVPYGQDPRGGQPYGQGQVGVRFGVPNGAYPPGTGPQGNGGYPMGGPPNGGYPPGVNGQMPQQPMMQPGVAVAVPVGPPQGNGMQPMGPGFNGSHWGRHGGGMEPQPMQPGVAVAVPVGPPQGGMQPPQMQPQQMQPQQMQPMRPGVAVGVPVGGPRNHGMMQPMQPNQPNQPMQPGYAGHVGPPMQPGYGGRGGPPMQPNQPGVAVAVPVGAGPRPGMGGPVMAVPIGARPMQRGRNGEPVGNNGVDPRSGAPR